MPDPENPLTRAWRIINILSQECKDEFGEPWQEALTWLHEFEEYRPLSYKTSEKIPPFTEEMKGVI